MFLAFEECDAANGFVHSATATCTNTCMEPDADQNCNIFPHEACVCEDGKVLKDGICVLPEECTEECVTDMGITVNVSILYINYREQYLHVVHNVLPIYRIYYIIAIMSY
jgi:hypothetical protein